MYDIGGKTYNGADFGRRAVNLNGSVDDGHFGEKMRWVV
jgi:hypothetical protein